MSTTIKWAPVTMGQRIPVGAGSGLAEKLGLPREFDATHRDYLCGLQAGLDSRDQRDAIATILDAIDMHATIRVWSES